MSTPYFRPQAIVQAEFVPLATSIILPQPVVLIGAEKKVFEANDTEDRTYINYGAYDPTVDTDYDYAGLPVGGVVQTDSVQLIIEDALARYATLSGANVIERGAAANQINIPTAAGFQTFNNGTTTYTRNSVFVNRDVQVGDRVKVTSGLTVLNSRITGFINDVVPAVVDAALANDSANPATVALTPSADGTAATTVNNGGTDHAVLFDTTGSTFLGDLGAGYITDTYTLEVILAGAATVAKFKVTSLKNDNVAEVTSVAFGTAFNIGTRGLRARITSAGTQAFVVGEKYTFTTTAAYTRHTPARATAADVYNGLFNTTYVITVIKGGTWAEEPQVSVTTTTGIDSGGPLVVAYNTNFVLGSLGISAIFNDVTPQDGLRLGDVYTISAVAAKKGAVRTATLAHPIDSSIVAGNDLSVEFYIHKDSITIPAAGYPLFGSENLEATLTNFTVKAGIQITDASWTQLDMVTLDPIPVISGTLIVPYIALQTANANQLRSLSDSSVIDTVVGKVIPSNPLAYALDKALANSGSQPVYFISIGTDDVQGFRDALGEHEARGTGYMVVPLSQDDAVLDLVRGHVDSLNGVNKLIRCIAFTSTTLPSVVLKYDKKPDTSNWLGYVSLLSGSSPAEYVHLTVPGATFITDGIRPGDTLRTLFGIDAFGNPIYQTATINAIIDEENADLVRPGFSVPVGSSGSPVQIQIARTLTKDERAVLEAANSSEFSDRFVYNVYPDMPLNADVPGYFVAAAVAGLASSVAPHQPVTNYTIAGFNDQTGSHTRFSPTQLDTMAEGGTLIVTQDLTGGANYIRHQLSTDNLDDLHSELSVTRNVHSIEAYIENLLKPLIGRNNITDYFLQIVDVTVRNALDYLQSSTGTPTAGTQIRSWDSDSLVIVQNAVARTEVDITVAIVVPLPANRIIMKLRVSA